MDFKKFIFTQRHSQGLFLIFISSFLFALVAILVRYLSFSMSAAEVFLFRCLAALLIWPAFVFFSKEKLKAVRPGLLVFRGLIGGIATLLFFMAVSMVGVSMATLLSSTSPIFVLIFSAIFLKEKAKKDAVLILSLTLIGATIILAPDLSVRGVGLILALLSGVFIALALVSISELRKTESALMVVLAYSVGGLVVCLPLVAFNYVQPTAIEWSLLLFMGVVAFIGQLGLTYAYKFSKATEGSTVSLSNLAFSAGLAALFFGEYFSSRELVGAILIVSASMGLIFLRRK